MSDRPGTDIVPSKGSGFFQDVALRIRLILRLMADRRVSFLLKLLPIGSLAYWFVPDMIPFPLDDAAVLWLLNYLFIELSPPEVVAEHMRSLTSVIDGEWKEIREAEADDPERGTNA